MPPHSRPDPTRTGIHPLAFAELEALGLDNATKPAAVAVHMYWRELRRDVPELKHQRLIRVESGERAGDWLLYVEKRAGTYVGFAQSEDGGGLRLLLVKSAKSISKKDAIRAAQDRAN